MDALTWLVCNVTDCNLAHVQDHLCALCFHLNIGEYQILHKHQQFRIGILFIILM